MDSFTKEEFRNFFIGICVAAAFLLTIIIVKLENNIWQGAEDSDYTVYATFNHTDGLVIGDKVRMAGIDIGYVAASVLDDDFDRRIVGTHNGMDYYYFLNSIETERDSMGRESWLCIKMNDDVWLKIFIFYEDIDDMSFIDDVFDFVDSCSVKILS